VSTEQTAGGDVYTPLCITLAPFVGHVRRGIVQAVFELHREPPVELLDVERRTDEALAGADVFIGVSQPGAISVEALCGWPNARSSSRWPTRRLPRRA